jgi:hypothetical protein
MALNYGPTLVTNGLVLSLDAADKNSYPGSGTTCYDLSGGGRNFTLTNGVGWDSAGYFTFDGAGDVLVGPASNTFNLGQEHTIEIVMKPTILQATTIFNWRDSGGGRQIMSHAPWSNNYVYYDVGGCCDVNQRVNYPTDLVNKITYMTYRTRTSITPYRQVFENIIEKVNSGGNSTATMTFGSPAAVIGGDYESGSWAGYLYLFRLYNRALTDQEIQQNYLAQKSRIGL